VVVVDDQRREESSRATGQEIRIQGENGERREEDGVVVEGQDESLDGVVMERLIVKNEDLERRERQGEGIRKKAR
jgi:hypothetical protein